MSKPIIAIRDGNTILINDLKDNEYGIQCNCICVACKKPLVAVKEGKRRAYFRHKANEEHCLYDSNEALLMYVWGILDDNKIIEDLKLSLDNIKFHKLTKKKLNIYDNESNNISISIKNVDKENKTFTLIINDEEYSYKMFFDKKDIENIDGHTMTLDLKDLLKNEQLSRDMVIDNILSLATESAKDYETDREYYKKKNIKEKKQIWKKIEFVPRVSCPKCDGSIYRYKVNHGTTLHCETCGWRPGIEFLEEN